MSHYEQCRRCFHDFASCGHYDGSQESLCGNYMHPRDNSNMFNSFFSWKGRYSRKQYAVALLFSIVIYFLLILVTLPAYLFFMSLSSSPFVSNLIYGAVVALVPSYILIVAGIKRTNDAGLPTIWAWVPVIAFWWNNIFVIVAAFFCLFYLLKDKGEQGVNEHGANPAEPYHTQLDFD